MILKNKLKIFSISRTDKCHNINESILYHDHLVEEVQEIL
jgi:hypothetical protein